MDLTRPNRKQIMLIAAAAVLVAAVVILCFVTTGGRDSASEPRLSPEPTSTLVPRTAVNRSYPTAKPSNSGNKGGVVIPGWSSIELPADSTEADVKLYNPTDNEGKYYLVFELRMKESGETLFTTGLVPPGMYCSSVTLTSTLEAGHYSGVLHVQPVRMDDQSLTNSADISLGIDVR